MNFLNHFKNMIKFLGLHALKRKYFKSLFVNSVVYFYLSIQLKYNTEEVSKLPVPREQAFFPKRRRGK